MGVLIGSRADSKTAVPNSSCLVHMARNDLSTSGLWGFLVLTLNVYQNHFKFIILKQIFSILLDYETFKLSHRIFSMYTSRPKHNIMYT